MGMRRPTPFPRALAAVLCLVSGGGVVAGAQGSRSPVAVVVNDAGPLAGASDTDLRDIFLGKVRFIAGTPVQPVRGEGPSWGIFLRSILGMTEQEFQLYWMRKSYEDGRLPPPIRNSAEGVLAFVASNPGAIGVVLVENWRATSGVRVLRQLLPAGSE